MGGHVSLVVKISLHTPVGIVGNVPLKFILKYVFWSVLVYILTLFVLKMFIAYLYEIMIVRPGG